MVQLYAVLRYPTRMSTLPEASLVSRMSYPWIRGMEDGRATIGEGPLSQDMFKAQAELPTHHESRCRKHVVKVMIDGWW